VAQDELHGVRAERDEVIRLAKNREAARIRTVFQAARQATEFEQREQELIRQIEELQIDVHRLNNIINPIIPLAPAVEDEPNVLIAEDDGVEMDAEEEPEMKRWSLGRTTMVMVCLTSTTTTPRSSLAEVGTIS